MTPAELITYYQNLLIIQYAAKTRARATIGSLVAEVVADLVVKKVLDGFNPGIPWYNTGEPYPDDQQSGYPGVAAVAGTAVGDQLDILAEYRGFQRQIYGLNITKTYFSLVEVADPSPGDYKGFAEVATDQVLIDWFFLTVPDINFPTYRMADQEMRQMLKYLAATQSCGGGMGEIQDVLDRFATGVTLFDNKDMTIDYKWLAAGPLNPVSTLAYLIDALDLWFRPAGVATDFVEA